MNTALGRGLVSGLAILTVAGAAMAAESDAKHVKAVTPAASSATPASAASTAAAPSARKPLDLRIGNVRNYMMPRDYRAALGAPDADENTVVVEGQRSLPIQSKQPIPGGFPPLALWWALRHPSNSWRILVPDVNAPAAGPPSVIPPPIFRPGP